MIWSLTLLFVFLAVALLSVSFAYFREREDLHRLQAGLQALLRDQVLPRRLRFVTRLGAELWRSFIALSSRVRAVEVERPAVDEMLSLTSRIVGEADEVSGVAREVTNMVLHETRPDVIASAVVVRDVASGELRIEHLEGIPQKRIGDALLMYADFLFDNKDLESWGYHVAERGTVFDFSTFGIGMSLAVPLRNQEQITGMLWLGLHEHASSLTAQRKAFVHAIAKHAASSFYAATKVRERSRKRDSEKDFLLGLSHDLRAPGNSALYALRDLISGELGPLTAEQHLRLSIIERSLEDQLGILGDVLDYAKHQKGFLQAKTTRTKLATVIARTLETFTLSAERKGLAFSCAAVLDTEIEIDPRHLQRILANFLSNAIKYTERGSIAVRFATVDTNLEILVSDTGIGIPAEEEQLLFKEFTQLSAGKSREQGFGLGLALSKALASLNGAYVRYERNASGGSIFVVGVPAVGLLHREESLLPMLNTVLVIDDDNATCRANRRYVDGIASHILTATSIEESLRLLDLHVIDLLVTDLNLGDGSAITLLERLRDKHRDTPALVITGSGYSPELEVVTNYHRVLVLEKPVSRAAIEGAIATLFSEPRVANA